MSEHTDEDELMSALYAAVLHLNILMNHARRRDIEVTLDVNYDVVLDAHRPHVALVTLKVAKLLSDRGV